MSEGFLRGGNGGGWLDYLYPVMVTAVIAVCLSGFLIRTLEERLEPLILSAARTQVHSAVTQVLEQTVLEQQEGLGYSDLVRVERAQDGSVTAVTTDMQAINRLRSGLMEVLPDRIARIDRAEIAIPLGSLTQSQLLWGRGPTIKVRSFTVGTVSAEFESEFLSAGINQTLHKIWLELSAPAIILLPGARAEIDVELRMCVAETVIVGKVPGYLQRATQPEMNDDYTTLVF